VQAEKACAARCGRQELRRHRFGRKARQVTVPLIKLMATNSARALRRWRF